MGFISTFDWIHSKRGSQRDPNPSAPLDTLGFTLILRYAFAATDTNLPLHDGQNNAHGITVSIGH